MLNEDYLNVTYFYFQQWDIVIANSKIYCTSREGAGVNCACKVEWYNITDHNVLVTQLSCSQ